MADIYTTIASSGGTYTSVQGWNDGIANTDNEFGTCTSAANLQSTALTLNAANSGGYTYTLTADSSSQVTAPTYSQATSKARIHVSSPGFRGNIVTISRSGFVIEKIDIGYDNGSFSRILISTGAFTFTVRRCILAITDSSGSEGAIYSSTGGTWTVSNCAIMGSYNGVNAMYLTNPGTINIYNTTVGAHQSPYGAIQRDAGTVNCYGVIVQRTNTTTSDFSGTIGGDYNVSQDTSAPGAGSSKSNTGILTNKTSGSEDFSISYTGNAARLVASRSGFPSDTDTDMAGTARSSTYCDAGCYQTTAPAGLHILNKVAKSGAGASAAINTLTADLIVVSTSDYAGSAAGLTDSLGNTWSVSPPTKRTSGPGGNSRASIYYCAAPTTGAGHTFTFTGGSLESFEVYVAKGAHATPYDTESGTGNGTQPGSMTPSVNGCLLVCALSADTTASVPTLNSGFIAVGARGYVSSQYLQSGGSYLIQTTAAAINPTWSDTGAIAFAAFKPVAVAASFIAKKNNLARQAVNRASTY